MLGLLKKDFLILKNEAILFIPMIIIMTVFLSSTFSFVFTFYSLSILFLVFGHDEKNNSYCYFSSFPKGRINIVRARYIFFLILNLVFLVFIAILFLVNRENIKLNEFYYISVGVLSVTIVISSIMLPLLYKFGAIKGRFILIALFFMFFLIGNFLGSYIYKFSVYFLLFEKHTYLILIFALLLYFISYFISIWVNNKKDY